MRVFREVERATRASVPNLFLAPLSVTLALGMLDNGAAGQTEAATPQCFRALEEGAPLPTRREGTGAEPRSDSSRKVMSLRPRSTERSRSSRLMPRSRSGRNADE